MAPRASGTGIIRFETHTSMSTIERMRINAIGNIGIGTSEPDEKLSVFGTIESTDGRVKFPDGTLQTTAVNDKPSVWNASIYGISYTNGNVGIGTSTPSNKLTLEGATSSNTERTFLEVRNKSTDNFSSVNVKLFAGSGSSFTGLYHHSDTYSSSANFDEVGALWNHGKALALRASGTGIIRFETHTSMSTIERMRINAIGNVGIGTSEPNAKLQIEDGDIYIEDVNSGVIMKSPNEQCGE